MVEPTARMRVMATQCWQMFVAYMQAGFTEDQALVLVLQQIRVQTGGQ